MMRGQKNIGFYVKHIRALLSSYIRQHQTNAKYY